MPRKKVELIPVGDILAQITKDPKLRQALELAKVNEEWVLLAGDEIAAHGRIKGIRDKVLYIETANSVWAHRYTYQKRALIRAINKQVGRKLVKDVFIVLAGEDFEAAEEGDEKAENEGQGS